LVVAVEDVVVDQVEVLKWCLLLSSTGKIRGPNRIS